MFFISTVFLIMAMAFSVKYMINLNSNDWIFTKGSINDISIESQFNSLSTRTGKRNTYQVKVNYFYIIAGEKYIGNNFFYKLPAEFDSRQEAEKFAKDYTIGEDINVFYQGSDPQQSCLIHYQMNKLQQNVIYALLLITAIVIEFFIYKIFWR